MQLNINLNLGGNRGMGPMGMGGFPGGMPMGMPMNGFGGMPMGQMGPMSQMMGQMGRMMDQMNQMGQMGQMGGMGGMNPMAMMSMMMMGMMAQMMGGGMGQAFPMQIGPGQFGQGMGGCGCGYPGGGGASPVGGFLGGGGYNNGGNYGGGYNNGGNYGGGDVGGYGPTLPPGGRIGNIDVGQLVSVLPQSQQRAANQHFPYIIQESQKQGITNKAQLAYILATSVHESGAGAHMEEFASGRAYEGRSSLGNSQSGDGERFKGRGYVQITGRRNYTDWSRRLGVDLVNNPRAAQDPNIAAQILVGGMKEGTFTGRRLDQYINDQGTDFGNARRIVNGTDRAGSIAGIAQRLLGAMG